MKANSRSSIVVTNTRPSAIIGAERPGTPMSLPPLFLSAGEIERNQLRQAVDGVQRGAVRPEAAADIGAVAGVFRLGIDAPEALAVGEAEGRDLGVGVHGEDDAVEHDRLRHDDLPGATAFADFGLPGFGQMVVGGEVSHQMGRIAARLGPGGVVDGRRQHDLRGALVDDQAATVDEDVLALARQDGFLVLEPTVEQGTAGEGQRGQERGPAAQQRGS